MAFDIMDWLFGHSPEKQQFEKLTPEQQQYQNQVLGMLGGSSGMGFDWLNQILSGDEEAFKAFEDPIKRQFEREIVPGISERFAGMGTGGAQDSSAFQQTLGKAGADLSTNLAALRSGLKMDAMKQLQGFMQPAYAQSYENVYDPGAYGIVGGMLQGAGEGAGKAGMNYFLPA